ALHWAAFQNDVEVAQTLVRAGARVDAVTRIGAITPLWLAAKNGNAALLEVLLKAGADPKTATGDGAVPLMAAALSGNAGAIGVLAKHGADLNAKDAVDGQTALMFAAARNRPDAVRELLRLGADASMQTSVRKLERPRVDEDGNPLPAPSENAAAGRGGRAG